MVAPLSERRPLLRLRLSRCRRDELQALIVMAVAVIGMLVLWQSRCR
jgi:hypothetical protein